MVQAGQDLRRVFARKRYGRLQKIPGYPVVSERVVVAVMVVSAKSRLQKGSNIDVG